MPDFDVIGTALAGRFSAAAITGHGGPPAGLTNVRKSTIDLPQLVTALPCVLVFPPSGRFGIGVESTNEQVGGHDYVVRFYLAKTKDLARELNACRRWLTILVDMLRGAVQLGGLVASARIETYDVGSLRYGGTEFTGIELGVRVVTTEGWSVTS